MIRQLCKMPTAEEYIDFYNRDFLEQDEPWEPYKSHYYPRIVGTKRTDGWEDWGSYRTKLKLITGLIKEKLEYYATDALSLLDVGCGLGYYLQELAGDFHFLTGIEINPRSRNYAEMLNVNNQNVSIYEGLEQAALDGRFLEPYDGVDFLLAIDFLEHIPKPKDYLKVMAKPLQGYIVVSTPIGEYPPVNMDRQSTINETHGHLWGWDREDVEKMFIDAEYDIDTSIVFDSKRFTPFKELIIIAKPNWICPPGFVKEQEDRYSA